MEKKLTLADLAKILEQYDVVELEDVTIKGDTDLAFPISCGITNCGECGEKTCLAFASHLKERSTRLEECTPLFEDEKFTDNP